MGYCWLFSASSCYPNHRSKPNQTTHLPPPSDCTAACDKLLWLADSTSEQLHLRARPGCEKAASALVGTLHHCLCIQRMALLKSLEFSSPGSQLGIRLFPLDIHKVITNSQNDHLTNLLRLDLLEGPVMSHRNLTASCRLPAARPSLSVVWRAWFQKA